MAITTIGIAGKQEEVIADVEVALLADYYKGIESAVRQCFVFGYDRNFLLDPEQIYDSGNDEIPDKVKMINTYNPLADPDFDDTVKQAIIDDESEVIGNSLKEAMINGMLTVLNPDNVPGLSEKEEAIVRGTMDKTIRYIIEEIGDHLTTSPVIIPHSLTNPDHDIIVAGII
jgi:hypothetical protein